jgi:hypothetical protein
MSRILPEFIDPDPADHRTLAADALVREEPQEEDEEDDEEDDEEGEDDGNSDGYSE